MQSKSLIGLGAFILGLVLIAGFAGAIGVTAYYYTGTSEDEKPLKMAPGETKDIYFELQNVVGNSDVNFKASIINGTNIAKIIDKNEVYLVPAGVKDVKVNVRVTLPKTAKLGERYNVGASFSTVSIQQGGGLSFGSAFDKYFDVVVEEQAESKSTGNNYLWYFIGIIVILGIIVFFISRKNRN